LFSDNPIPLAEGSPLDVVCALFEAKLQYAPGERDMLIMQHKFTIHWMTAAWSRCAPRL
jgi:hypothetical protein